MNTAAALSKKTSVVNDNLIFDIGVNLGEDSRFYLDKGFSVVGVEANPLIATELRTKFSDEIQDGRFILEECGIWSHSKSLPFFRNLDNDHWSSFDPNYGCRNGSAFEEMEIKCITSIELFKVYGIPRYLKIDVEGADKYIVADLASLEQLPTYVSVEEYGFMAIDDLHKAGYNHFYFSPQRDKKWAVPPMPPKEGQYFNKVFNGYDSGLFGEELPGEWMEYDRAVKYFIENIRNREHEYIGAEHEWYDIHAKIV